MNKIFNEDIFEFLDTKVENESVQLIVADPPYNMLPEKWDKFKNDDEYIKFMTAWIQNAAKKLVNGGSIYLFNTAYNSARLIPILEANGLNYVDWIVWYKKDGLGASRKKFVNNQEVILLFSKGKDYYFDSDSVRIPYISSERIKHAAKKGILKNGKRWFPNPNGKLCSNVWEIASERHTTKVNGRILKFFHPTPKPEQMIDRIILASSKENDLILDLFSGSGTTTMCAIGKNRNSLGCELDLDYYNLTIERIKNKYDEWNNE